MNTTTLQLRNSVNWLHIRLAFLLIALGCSALLPQARATCQDACLTNGNTVQGDNALISNTSGYLNTAIGFEALFNNTTGYVNTAIGDAALGSNTTGNNNTANGVDTLESNSTGNNNTASGVEALFANTTGNNNTASGVGALLMNTTGNNNTATGLAALDFNETGSYNTATGANALENSGGGSNTATGFAALTNNATGIFNTASGLNALKSNSAGTRNTADGVNALLNNTVGSYNVALGVSAGSNLTTGSNNIEIGNSGVAGEANKIRIGATQTATFLAGISGATVPTGVAVIVDANGHLGTTTSSSRFKEAIKPMDKASESILALKPVTFRYKHEIDPEGIQQFGLVAEQVEKVNPDLVARDGQGKAYTVRYESVNAMLLNEFLKEHREVEELNATVSENSTEIKTLAASLKGQASQIQKLSAQVATVSPRRATPVADNNQ